MNWGSAAEFFAMGGKAYYVWGAYVVTLAVMLGELWLLRRGCRAAPADSVMGENEISA